MPDLASQIIELKQEIDAVLKQIRCPQCNKLLAIQKEGKTIIRCGRCGHDHTLD